MSAKHPLSRLIGFVLALCSPFLPARADDGAPAGDKLMAVVRESAGANKQDETLQAAGPAKIKLADGREQTVDMAMFDFIGDMHVRLVFDGANSMRVASTKELAQLQLTTDAALQLAVANLKRTYGEPVASEWTAGVMQVEGKSPDFDSSYVLDRAFWQGLLVKYPAGLVVAVPKRGGLLFAPLENENAVAALRRGVVMLYTSSGQQRVSSALYLFKDNRWSVFQAPAAAH